MTEPLPSISATDPDLTRERPRQFWDPGPKLLRALRDYQGATGLLAPLAKRWAVLRHRFWSAVTSCDIPINTRIGGGLLLPHPVGIVVHKDTVIGPNCLIMQNVTLGLKGQGEGGLPVLDGGVDVSAGAVVLGPIRLGPRALVAANAVVVKDVGAGEIVGGIPAAVIGRRS